MSLEAVLVRTTPRTTKGFPTHRKLTQIWDDYMLLAIACVRLRGCGRKL